ncbi:MAG TPA: RHS repeat-associated core domain-containing protein [Ktedonobacteraceae bacterium]|nr:RHS repeat-associated core domain-containing protein [Ktedonobacteraceae bacterium]
MSDAHSDAKANTLFCPFFRFHYLIRLLFAFIAIISSFASAGSAKADTYFCSTPNGLCAQDTPAQAVARFFGSEAAPVLFSTTDSPIDGGGVEEERIYIVQNNGSSHPALAGLFFVCNFNQESCNWLSAPDSFYSNYWEVFIITTTTTPAQPVKATGSGDTTNDPAANGTPEDASGCGCNGLPNNTGSVKAGEPIDIGTGNVFYAYNDYGTSGSNILSFSRYYNSRASATTDAATLGKNWRSTYDRSLTIVSSTSVTAERADGQVLSFTSNGTAWVGDSDVDVALTQSGTGAGSTWKLTDQNDVTETYTQLASGEALLSTIVDRDGYTQTLTYNSSNQLTSVSDSFGRSLALTYAGGLLNTVTTPDGLIITYTYGSSGLTPGVNDRLASVSYSTNPVTSQSYSYVQNFALSSVTDENGNTYASWTYDSANRGLTSQMGSGATLMTITYNDGDGSRTVTNALGETETYTFTTLQGVPKVSGIDRAATSTVAAARETFTYDNNGYMASATDWNGNVTRYTNDAHGQPTTIVVAAGTAQQQTTTISYDTIFVHLPHQMIAPRLTTTFTYDSSGNLLTQTKTDTSSGSTNGQQHITEYTYDAFGHVLTMTDSRGNVTTYTYSSNNLSTITNALGQVSHITSYNQSGMPLSMTDPNGTVTTLTYDIRDRLLSRTVQAASGNATTTFGYDAAGDLTLLTMPDNSKLFYAYDSAHRVTQVSDNVGESFNYTLDANGDIIAQTRMNANSTVAQKQSGVFDSLGRMLQQIGASSQTTSYTYDANGNPLGITNPLGNTMTQAFDPLNRLITATDPLNNSTSNTYDAQNNLTSVKDPRSLTTTYTYNGFGQVIQQNSPDTGVTTYTLDQDGNVISEKDARGVVTNRTFDKLNRVLTETYSSSPSENVTYTYDAHNATNEGIGYLTGFNDKSGSTTFTYNAHGDVLTDTRTVNGKQYTTIYRYDAADHITSMTDPSGHSITYTYDAVGRIASVGFQSSANGAVTILAKNVNYEPFGPLSGFTYGNGFTHTRTYDQDYQLTGIQTAGSNVQNETLSYDAAGNITSITDNLDSTRNQTFIYDKDNRLIQATGKYGTISYTYDADGNWASQTGGSTTTTYAYPTTSNQLASVNMGSTTGNVTSTANGDIITDNDGAQYTYNAANRNNKIKTKGGVGATYQYNALSERVLKEVDNTITSYQYDEQGHVIAESNGRTGAVIREYIYLGDMPLAQIESSGAIEYIQTDQSGTPQTMTDNTGKVVWDRIQLPFGETYSIAGTATTNLRAPGQYFDSESGLNYNLFRTYNPTLGRYTQADPIGLAGGINPYAYVLGNPVKSVDSFGLYSQQSCARFGLCDPATNNFTPPPLTISTLIGVGATYASLFLGPEVKMCQEVATGILTSAERAEIQAIANRFMTQIDVVGSRAAGQGRNIEDLSLPVGKGPGTRSDIDFNVNGQDIINSRGALNDQLNQVGNGAGKVTSVTGQSYPPVIPFKPQP